MQQHPGDTAKPAFFDLWRQCNILMSLPTVWGHAFAFFLSFDETCENMFQQLKIDT